MLLDQPPVVRSLSRSLPALLLFAALCAASAHSQDVLTYHNNNARTGLDNKETTLTLANVNSTTFGKLFTVPADGLVDAEPLYLSAVSISGVTHNLLIVATEHDTVYAYDADTGTNLWQITTLKSGETTSDKRGCPQVDARDRNHLDSRHLSSQDRQPGHLRRRHVERWFRQLPPAPARPRRHQRRRTLQRSRRHRSPVSRHRRQQFRRLRDLRSRPIQRARRPAPHQQHRLSRLGLALRLPSLHRMDHGLQRHHTGADHRAQRDSQRQRRRHLGFRRRHGRRQRRQHLPARRQRSLRHHSEFFRLPRKRRLRQRLPPPHHQRRTRRRRLLRDVQPVHRKRHRHRSRIRRRPARQREGLHRQNVATRHRRRQRRQPLRRRPHQHGQIQFRKPTTSTRNSTASSQTASGPCPRP